MELHLREALLLTTGLLHVLLLLLNLTGLLLLL